VAAVVSNKSTYGNDLPNSFEKNSKRALLEISSSGREFEIGVAV